MEHKHAEHSPFSSHKSSTTCEVKTSLFFPAGARRLGRPKIWGPHHTHSLLPPLVAGVHLHAQRCARQHPRHHRSTGMRGHSTGLPHTLHTHGAVTGWWCVGGRLHALDSTVSCDRTQGKQCALHRFQAHPCFQVLGHRSRTLRVLRSRTAHFSVHSRHILARYQLHLTFVQPHG